MSLIVFLILGGVIGYLAALLLGRHEGILASVVIGIIGSFIGGLIARLFTGGQSFLSLTWSGVFWSLIGSVILVALLNAFTGRREYHA